MGRHQEELGLPQIHEPRRPDRAYLSLADKLRPLVESRLSAAVYTQTTDCETEVNGLMTYDRELIKMDVDKIRAANTRLVHLLDSQSPKAQ